MAFVAEIDQLLIVAVAHKYVPGLVAEIGHMVYRSLHSEEIA